MYTHNKFFKVFLLLIIAAYSYFHASLLEDISWLQSTVLLGGFIFAVFAHTKSGYLMIILLLVHMESNGLGMLPMEYIPTKS
jgi:hypothetical protein